MAGRAEWGTYVTVKRGQDDRTGSATVGQAGSRGEARTGGGHDGLRLHHPGRVNPDISAKFAVIAVKYPGYEPPAGAAAAGFARCRPELRSLLRTSPRPSRLGEYYGA